MKKPRVRFVPRERDDEVLRWLAMRDAGVPIAEIARRCGVKDYQSVQSAMKAVDEESEE